MGYVGETNAKRLARVALYEKIGAMWSDRVGYRPRHGVAVVLAGHEAAEVGCLHHILRFPLDRVIVADFEEAGLIEAKRRWPDVRIHHGDVSDALVCGPPSLEPIYAYAKSGVPGATLAMTYLRGRETAKSEMWRVKDASLKKTRIVEGRA